MNPCDPRPAVFLHRSPTIRNQQEVATCSYSFLTRVSLIVVVAQAGLAGAQTPTPRGPTPPPPAQSEAAETREANLRAYVELLRSDIRGQAAALITELMEFTEAEDAAFWPIYREFESDLAKINDERLKLIQDYADNYDKITDAIADQLATKALELESRARQSNRPTTPGSRRSWGRGPPRVFFRSRTRS